jgi:hypothetical protein
LRARPGYLRTALAVLALVGQLTPAVALPVAASARLFPARPGACAATGSASCACSATQQAAAACCCSEPKPPAPAPQPEPPKPTKTSCCEAADAPKKAKGCCGAIPPAPTVAKPLPAKPATEPGAQIVAGGKCKCDKPAPLANAEPAVPHAHTDVVAFDAASAPGVFRWVAPASAGLLPPPYPPPRA